MDPFASVCPFYTYMGLSLPCGRALLPSWGHRLSAPRLSLPPQITRFAAFTPYTPVPFYLTFSHPLSSATHQNVWIPLYLPTTQLCSLCSTNMHLAVITKLSYRSKSNPWFTSALHVFRSSVRCAENTRKRTRSTLDWSSFITLRNRYHKQILASKNSYYSNLVSFYSDNPRSLWQTINNLLHRKSSSPLSSCT